MAVRRAVLILLIAFGASPLIAASGVLPRLSAVLDRWFAFQCQRDSSRALELASLQLPVCGRCFGIYLGIALGALLGAGYALVAKRGGRLVRLPAGRQVLSWTCAGAALMLLDVGSELLGLRPALIGLRVASGLALALPVAVTLGVWSCSPADCAAAGELQHSD